MRDLTTFEANLNAHFQSRITTYLACEEITLEVAQNEYLSVLKELKDIFHFEVLIDLCGVDYSTYDSYTKKRFAVVLHLLSVSQNRRLRVRTFLDNDAFPLIESASFIWPSANWYEREAFDLLGIHFENHPDLRRILTDYNFVGHPLRKEFPSQGLVEVIYDQEKKAVVYQPTTIAPREITPRIVRGSHD